MKILSNTEHAKPLDDTSGAEPGEFSTMVISRYAIKKFCGKKNHGKTVTNVMSGYGLLRLH